MKKPSFSTYLSWVIADAVPKRRFGELKKRGAEEK